MKRVLVITYYWPPAGGIGVHRTLKFVKYLRKFNWEPVVYAPANASYPYLDNTNFKHIPEDVKIIKRPILEPFNLFKKVSGRPKDDPSNPLYARDKKVKFIDDLAIWIRGNFFIPDARCLWIGPSVKFLKKYLKENPVDAILSNGPPHTNTMIACMLAQKLDIPWLADFQDPWTQVDYYKMFKISKIADKRHRKMEQKVFKTADKITIASPTWARDLEKIGAQNVDPVFWGYDEDDFKDIHPNPDKEFSIVHAGLLGFDRNPETLIRVLGEFKKSSPEFAKNLRLKFAGVVDFAVKEAITKNGLEKNLIALGSVTMPEALQLISNARLLLLPLNKAENAMGRIPGKLFENIRSGVPILCLGPENSDVDRILKGTNSGITINYDDYKSLKNYIVEQFLHYSQNRKPAHRKDYTQYSVVNQVKKIADFLNEIT